MLKNSFAIVLPWPHVNSAEKEAIERARIAASNLDLTCRVVDTFGYDIETGKRPSKDEIDFVISTHFTTPKTLDAFSLVVTTNPMEYFLHPVHGEGSYQRYTDNLLTHDDFLSCASQCGDDQIKRSLYRDALHLKPELIWYFSCPLPAIPVTEKQRKLFYITTNWDLQRHANLLQSLDCEDIIEIYGPSARLKKAGYRNYKGELPFDGKSVVKRIGESGAVLVISSPDHIASDMMSSRLYEGLAAGAVAICDQNPFPRRHFGDSLLYVDTEKPDIFEQVNAHMQWMNSHPDQAAQMAERAQQIFLEKFSLDHCVKTIYKSLEKRQKELTLGLNPDAEDNPKVQLLYLLTDASEIGIAQCKATCCGQDYRALSLTIAMEPDPKTEKALAQLFKGSGTQARILPLEGFTRDCSTRRGRVLAAGLNAVDKDCSYLNILTSEEKPFSNHISSLVRLMQQNPDHMAGATAEIFEMPSHHVGEVDMFDSYSCRTQTSTDFSSDLNQLSIGFCRFIFRRQAIDKAADRIADLLPYLHHKSMAALTTGLTLARSGLATVLVDRETAFFEQPVEHEMEDPLIRQVHPSFQGWSDFGESPDQVARDQRRKKHRREKIRRRQRRLRRLIFAVLVIGAAATALYLLASTGS